MPSINIYWPEATDLHVPPQLPAKNTCSTASWDFGAMGTSSSAQDYMVAGTANCAPALANSFGNPCHDKTSGCWMSPLHETFLIARAQARALHMQPLCYSCSM